MKPTLLVLAAGMGSRYGGLKQIDPVGLNDETILEFSVYDAIKAGFGKVVFIIRLSIEQPFKEKIGIRQSAPIVLNINDNQTVHGTTTGSIISISVGGTEPVLL